MKKLLFILTISLFSLNLANSDSLNQKQETIFAEDPWDFLETQFIKTPQEQASKLDKVALKLLITAVPALYTWGLSMLVSSSYISAIARNTLNIAHVPDDSAEKIVYQVGNALGAVACLVPTYYVLKTIYNKIHDHILSKIEEGNLKTFIENWPNNKQITPPQFQEDFEKLYSKFKKQSTTLDIKKVNILLKKSIARHFGRALHN